MPFAYKKKDYYPALNSHLLCDFWIAEVSIDVLFYLLLETSSSLGLRYFFATRIDGYIFNYGKRDINIFKIIFDFDIIYRYNFFLICFC